MTSSTRSFCVSALTRAAPGRVDSPPDVQYVRALPDHVETRARRLAESVS